MERMDGGVRESADLKVILCQNDIVRYSRSVLVSILSKEFCVSSVLTESGSNMERNV